MKHRFAAVPLAALGCISAAASTFSLIPSADAFVSAGPGGVQADENFGGGGSLSVAADGLPEGEFQSVLKFNLAAAVSAFNTEFGLGNWTLTSATLKLTAATPTNPIFNAPGAGSFGISWMQNDSWVEGSGTPSSPGTTGITFNSLNSTFIGPADENLGTFSYGGGVGSTVYTLGLGLGSTSDVMAGGDMSLRVFAADSTISEVFNSRSFGTAAARPSLTLEAQMVPEPGILALGGLGLAALLARRRRRG